MTVKERNDLYRTWAVWLGVGAALFLLGLLNGLRSALAGPGALVLDCNTAGLGAGLVAYAALRVSSVRDTARADYFHELSKPRALRGSDRIVEGR